MYARVRKQTPFKLEIIPLNATQVRGGGVSINVGAGEPWVQTEAANKVEISAKQGHIACQ